MKLRVGDVVFIEWEDHYSRNNGWCHADRLSKLDRYMCRSVGVITQIDKKLVSLAQNWHHPKDKSYATMVADFMVIMRNSIQDIKLIKKKEIKV